MEERLRLHRLHSRILEVAEDDGTSAEYPVRADLDVETMATFLEIEEVLTSNRHPETGQPLTGNEKAHYYRLAHSRVIEVVRERTPNARLSLSVNELLATMAMLCGNVSVAREIADGLADAAGVETAEPGAEGETTMAAAAGTESPFVPSETFSPSTPTGSETETTGGLSTGEISPGESSSDTSPTPVEPTVPVAAP